MKGNEIIHVVNKAYSKVVAWKKNLFKVPFGKIGQEFIEEVNRVALKPEDSSLQRTPPVDHGRVRVLVLV